MPTSNSFKDSSKRGTYFDGSSLAKSTSTILVLIPLYFASISADTFCSLNGDLETRTMFNPFLAKANAYAFPMPSVDPVMTKC